MDANPEILDAQALVVGAGPVGLSAAIELGTRGHEVVVLEQRSRAGSQPRAKTTNVRTMQHMRRWGVAEDLRAAAPLPRDYPTDVLFSTTLFGRRLALIENAFEGAKRRDERFPEPAQWVPQYTVEAVLRERLSRLPNVRFQLDALFEDAVETEDGVVATARDLKSDRPFGVRAKYLIGADGARSGVRKLIGAKMEGEHALGHHYNLILRIPELEQTPPSPRAIMYWLVNPQSPAVMSPLDRNGVWAFGTSLAPGVREIDDEELRKRVHAAVGRPVEFEILERDIWAAHRLIADRYRRGRMFLAGDACHLHPPFGGYGMNLGVADGVDLGWKLSAVLQGWGGEGLLASYEQERRPVHQRTIAEAIHNFRTLSADLLKENLEDDSAAGERARAAVGEEIIAKKSREFQTLGVVLGSRYEDSPIVISDGSAPPEEHHARYQPSAHPGCLAPHAWLADGRTLYDRLSQGFTLLWLDNSGERLAGEISAAASTNGVPLVVLDLRSERLATLYEAPLALIRPDQYVAWRGSRADPVELILTVMRMGGAIPNRGR